MSAVSRKKIFVLDTNVLLHNSQSLESFADNTVVLPMTVIEELDKFKTNSDELGRNARQVIRFLDKIRSKGKLGEGVPTERGGLIMIISASSIHVDSGLRVNSPDNRILQVAYGLHTQGRDVTFVSKDINARIKADALGLVAKDYEKQMVNVDEMYLGYIEKTVNTSVIDNLYANGEIVIDEYEGVPNELILLHDETNAKHTGVGKYVKNSNKIVVLNDKFDRAWQIKPRNMEQRLALELLLDQNIPIITMVGQAGTGKTFLALAAALELTLRQKLFDKILVSRPIMPLGKDIGFLPGSKDDKLKNWMQPIFDNLQFLMRTAMPGEKENVEKRVQEMIDEDILSLEALTYIRGRSISRHFMIVDEAQNLTPHEIKTIVSRVGEGTKIVLTGDPYQIDNPYLDVNSNGLTYAAEHLKAVDLHGHITLRKSERSSLAAAAAELL